MLIDSHRAWLAYHVFYYGDQDLLLTNCVRTLVTELRGSRNISSYFFVRHWNGGPHVRLRLRHTGNVSAVRQAVTAALHAFFKEHPAARDLSHQEYDARSAARASAEATPGGEEEVLDLQGADTVLERPYLYESTRYGNWNGAREATEKHFCFSSDLAMFILEQTRGNPDSRLTIALHLTAATAGQVASSIRDAQTVLKKACRSLERLFPAEGLDSYGLLTERGFPELATIASRVASIVRREFCGRAVPTGEAALGRLIDSWRADLSKSLDILARTVPPGHDSTTSRLRGIDFMHMLNNRLGVPVDQECFAYGVVAEALSDVAA